MTPIPHVASMTPGQYGATILKKIVPSRLDSLKALLQSIGDDIDGNAQVPFARLTSAHFMSWFIVEGGESGPEDRLRFDRRARPLAGSRRGKPGEPDRSEPLRERCRCQT
jgi:hypothetical protein